MKNIFMNTNGRIEKSDYSFEEYRILKEEAVDKTNVFYQHLQIFATVLASGIVLLSSMEESNLIGSFWFYAIVQFFLYIFLIIQANHVIYVLFIRDYLISLENHLKHLDSTNYPRWESEFGIRYLFSIKSINAHGQIIISFVYIFLYTIFLILSWNKKDCLAVTIQNYYIGIIIFELLTLLYLGFGIGRKERNKIKFKFT